MERLTFLSHRWTLSHSPDLSGLKKKCLCPQKVVKSCPKGSERLVWQSGTAAVLTPPAASPTWPGSAGSRAEGLQCRREVPVHPPARDPISTWAFTWGWISPAPRKALFAFLRGISQAHWRLVHTAALAAPVQPPPLQTLTSANPPGSPPQAQRVKNLLPSITIASPRSHGPSASRYKRPDLIPAADDSHCTRRLLAMSGDQVSN